MVLEDLVVLVITMITLGQIIFCLPQLLTRAIQTQTYLPLAAFLTANGVIALGPTIFLLLPAWGTVYIASIFPAWLLLGPTLWLYVEGLTSENPWRLQKIHAVHTIPFLFGLIVAGMILSLPIEIRQHIFYDEIDINSGFPLVVVISIFLAMIMWALQSGYYVVRIALHLTKYRKRLKDLFASNEQRELGWLSWVLIVTCLTWLFAFSSLSTTLVQDHSIFGYRFGTALLLILVWTLAHWGLRQKPGFEGRYAHDSSSNDKSMTDNSDSKDNKKYQRSALDKAQSLRIADKISKVMEVEELHLDSSLSLQKLAQHVAIPPSYISQTLNETMGTNFFDFVNKWRIESAKPKIIANEDTVLNIALEVGFNARSSFYKVFKKETGKTPTEYRKAHQA